MTPTTSSDEYGGIAFGSGKHGSPGRVAVKLATYGIVGVDIMLGEERDGRSPQCDECDRDDAHPACLALSLRHMTSSEDEQIGQRVALTRAWPER